MQTGICTQITMGNPYHACRRRPLFALASCSGVVVDLGAALGMAFHADATSPRTFSIFFAVRPRFVPNW